MPLATLHLLTVIALVAPADPAPVTPMPTGPALTAAVQAADTEFFRLFFTGCDAKRLDTMIAPNFEMYHDRDGVVATDGASFVTGYAKSCEAKKDPDAWRSRRELVPDSLTVDPVPGYGAIEEGDHIFYERRGAGPEKKVGAAHFTQLWHYDAGQWRLARVFSYAHRAVE